MRRVTARKQIKKLDEGLKKYKELLITQHHDNFCATVNPQRAPQALGYHLNFHLEKPWVNGSSSKYSKQHKAMSYALGKQKQLIYF